MAKYIVQLRRGTKEQWEEYEATEPSKSKPRSGELVLEYDNGVPRLKIGDGETPYSQLPYISVDSFVLPKPISVTLYADKWEQATNADGEIIPDTYRQVVTVDNAVITPNSKVDLLPNPTQLLDFYDMGITLTTENANGVVTTYVVGDKPEKSYIIQAVVTEVAADE